jgi:hypothetical protein
MMAVPVVYLDVCGREPLHVAPEPRRSPSARTLLRASRREVAVPPAMVTNVTAGVTKSSALPVERLGPLLTDCCQRATTG